jgi:hypothetical protein
MKRSKRRSRKEGLPLYMDSTIDQRKGVKYIIYQEFIYNKIYTPMS